MRQSYHPPLEPLESEDDADEPESKLLLPESMLPPHELPPPPESPDDQLLPPESDSELLRIGAWSGSGECRSGAGAGAGGV